MKVIPRLSNSSSSTSKPFYNIVIYCEQSHENNKKYQADTENCVPKVYQHYIPRKLDDCLKDSNSSVVKIHLH